MEILNREFLEVTLECMLSWCNAYPDEVTTEDRMVIDSLKRMLYITGANPDA